MDGMDVNTTVFPFLLLILVARQPPVGQGLLIHEVSRSHTTTHHIRQDSSGRVISPSQRPLPDTTLTTDRHPGPQRDSNPQTQQRSSRRPTPQTVRPLGQVVFPTLLTIYSPHLQWSCQVARATEFFTVVSNIHEHPPPPNMEFASCQNIEPIHMALYCRIPNKSSIDL